jgi:hypothetical protein
MSLASSDPHEHIGVDLLGARIIFWAMDLLCHGGVVMKVAVDGEVAVRLGFQCRFNVVLLGFYT